MAGYKNFNVESKIRYIIEQRWKPDADYGFYNWPQANVAFDGMKRPRILYVLPPSGALFHQHFQTTDRPRTMVGFYCNSEYDFNTHQNDALMCAMKMLAAMFIREINKSGLFEPIPDKTEIPYRADYSFLNQNVTGILIEIELKEIEGVKFCE